MRASISPSLVTPSRLMSSSVSRANLSKHRENSHGSSRTFIFTLLLVHVAHTIVLSPTFLIFNEGLWVIHDVEHHLLTCPHERNPSLLFLPYSFSVRAIGAPGVISALGNR